MKPSAEKRYVSDIEHHNPGLVGRIRRGGPEVLNLRRSFVRKYSPWIFAGALLLGLLFFARHAPMRAKALDFYPTTCLGTWANPHLAEGQPDNLNFKDGMAFNASNSAVYNSGSDGIFCGGFIAPDFKPEGEIVNLGLTLVWEVETPDRSSSMNVPSSAPSETGATSTPTIQPQESSAPTSFLDYFFHRVFAQEVDTSTLSQSSDTANSPAQSEPQTSDSAAAAAGETDQSSTVIGPPILAPLQPLDPSSAASDTISETVIQTSTPPIAPVPDENFLRIMYSLDGQTWIPLQTVNLANYKNLTVSVPVSSWDDLKRLQFNIQGIPTALANVPRMYLDGMFLEAHYNETVFDQLNSTNTTSTASLENIPNPFPGYPQVILNGGAVKKEKQDWKLEESPELQVDMSALPAAQAGDSGQVPIVSAPSASTDTQSSSASNP